MDAEVVWLDEKGVPEFDTLHSRIADHCAVACAFDLLTLNGDDLRRQPFLERKRALARLLIRSRGGIQYVEHAEGHGDTMFEAVCTAGLEGIVSKRPGSFYRSGPTKMWIKVKNPKAPAQGGSLVRFAVIELLMRPCAIALTLTRIGASSSASELVNVSIPPLAAPLAVVVY